MKKSPSHFVNKVQPKHWLGPGSGHSFLFLSSLDRRRIRRILRADRLPLPVASKHVVRFMVRSQCLQVRQISHRDEQLLTFDYMLKKLSYAWFCGLPQGQDLPCTAASDETSGIRVIPVPKKVVSLLPFNERLASSKPTKEDEFKTPFDWVFTSQEIPSLDAVASGCTDQHIIRSRPPSLTDIFLKRVTSHEFEDTDRDVGVS